MDRPHPAYDLRPLSVGEVLDRAVTLTLRNFWLLAALATLMLLPKTVISYSQTTSLLNWGDSIVQAAKAPDGKTKIGEIFKKGPPVPSNTSVELLLLNLAWTACAPIVAAAIIAALGAAYVGPPIPPVRALRIGLERWLPMVGFAVSFGTVMMLAAIPLIIVAVLISISLMVPLGALVTSFHLPVVGVIAATVLMLAGGVVAFAVAVFVNMLWQLGFIAVIQEREPPFRAIGHAVRRLAVRTDLRRTILIGTALTAFALFSVLASLFSAAFFAFVWHSAAAGVAGSFIVTLVSVPILSAIPLIYYYDVRVRREGFDLEREAAATLA